MLIIITGNRTGKGNGERVIISLSEPFSASVRDAIEKVVDKLYHHKVIRISQGDDWICDNCKRKNITKIDNLQCQFCRRNGRKIVNGERVIKDRGKLIEGEIEEMFREQKLCPVCGLRECKCQS